MFEYVGYVNLLLYCQWLFVVVRVGGLVMNYGIILCFIDGCLVVCGVGEFIDRYVFL